MPGPPDTQQRSGFMDLHITHGAVFVGLQVTHDASFADLGGVDRERTVRAPFLPQDQPPFPLLRFRERFFSTLSQQFRAVQRPSMVIHVLYFWSLSLVHPWERMGLVCLHVTGW